MNHQYLIVFCTVPNEETAKTISVALLSENLAACCNILPGIRSLYKWKGEVCDESELLMIIKSRGDRYDDLEARIAALHPYDVPEVLAIPVKRGAGNYLKWMDENVEQ